jgi:hypothetical protein
MVYFAEAASLILMGYTEAGDQTGSVVFELKSLFVAQAFVA